MNYLSKSWHEKQFWTININAGLAAVDYIEDMMRQIFIFFFIPVFTIQAGKKYFSAIYVKRRHCNAPV